ncbi:MAG: 1,4-alpha-glucan branching protein domain-containing protein [Myxococcota bacterium]
MSNGTLCLVLHAHLPWVRHPEHPHFLEEDWLYEAITETYIPLLAMMDDLERDGVPFALTMSLTPPLCEMLADPLLRSRYTDRLNGLVELARNVAADKRDTPFADGAAHALGLLERALAIWRDRYGTEILRGFKHHQDAGHLVILTCGATHGLLPLTATQEARRAQIMAAKANYRKHFGRDPDGIWLGECAYQDGIDELLRDAGIRFFFTETHGITWAKPRPRFGHYRPVLSEAGVAVFARDPACSRQVWSAETGYPGDPLYREFYRDAGWDAPLEWLQTLLGGGPRKSVGLKLHRVTGKVPLHEKEPYVPAWAEDRARVHARHFLAQRVEQIREIRQQSGIEPVLVAPYDAELFGHWWFEGPVFIEAMFRQAHDFKELRFDTPRGWLAREPDCQIVKPCPSSWGDKGFWDVWLNGENAWMYKHLYRAEERMIRLAKRDAAPGSLEARALAQAGRELLLAQSSDWAFIVTMRTTVPYAVKRTRMHLAAFDRLFHELTEGHLDEGYLKDLEDRSPIFGELDWKLWRSEADPASETLPGVSSQPIG